MRKKNLLLGLLVAGSAVVLASCGGSNNSKTNESSQDLGTSGAPSVPAESSQIISGTDTISSQEADVEKRSTDIQTLADFDKDIDVSKLEPAYLTLRQSILMEKAMNDLNVSTVSGYTKTIHNEYYDGTLYNDETTTNVEGKLYNNDVIEYSINNKVDGNDNYGPMLPLKEIAVLPEFVSLSDVKKVSVPFVYGNYITSGTIAYNNNYVYRSTDTKSQYGNYSNNDIAKSTINDEKLSFLSKFTSKPNQTNIYKLDEHHYVANYSYEDNYNETITVGYDSNKDEDIKDTRTYSYSGAYVCYFSYFENEFTVDYIYSNYESKTNYLYDNYSGYPMYFEDSIITESNSFEVVFSYNDNGDYEDKADFLSSFDGGLHASNSSASLYTPTYNDQNEITSISSSSTISSSLDTVSSTNNSVTYEFAIDFSTEKLFALKNNLYLTAVNSKVLAGEDLESSESAIIYTDLSVELDLSEVELPEGFKIVTFDNKQYVMPKLNDGKYYVSLFNITATYDAQKKEVSYVINSVEFFEMKNSSSVKPGKELALA